ncbi:fec operon regulator FecR [Maioricimonas rarisocia]|uniref:Fec operon regulator FecR n=1 Tax=Maioricimonas rarisocia TaxID=2528026 RepID=A0A517Z864_9PLAN|nr:FecR family protein [Maioricimonas rarisocia]QDU38639.1 fec operon regulator FecR [Maioricimonas rarisocia]
MVDELKSLIRSYSDGEMTPGQLEHLEGTLRSEPAARELFLSELNLRAALEDAAIDASSAAVAAGDRPVAPLAASTPGGSSAAGTRLLLARMMLAVAAVAVSGIVMLFVLSAPQVSPPVAVITGVSGPLIWTGNGGHVRRELTLGTELSGGTIEGVAPESWFELTFRDGSEVMLSGPSTLTFSDDGQKELRLLQGSFSASVVPQPAGKPMRIHTRSALLEVLGTRFSVDAERSATVLTVNEGTVRATRLSDGDSVEVAAHHRVVAAADRELAPAPVPDSVNHWQSHLSRGPAWTYGDWSPQQSGRQAALSAIPYTTETGRTIYTAALGVSTGDTPSVLLLSNSQIRVRGRLDRANRVYFGITVRRTNGDFAGRFQTILLASQFGSGEFEVVLPITALALDPSLNHMRHELPVRPTDLIVESVWCHTLYDRAGLAVTSVELIPPAGSAP